MYVFLDYLCCFLNSNAMIALIYRKKSALKPQLNTYKRSW